MESAEQLALKNLKINSFREDGEVGKGTKREKKPAFLFRSIVHYHLHITKSCN